MQALRPVRVRTSSPSITEATRRRICRGPETRKLFHSSPRRHSSDPSRNSTDPVTSNEASTENAGKNYGKKTTRTSAYESPKEPSTSSQNTVTRRSAAGGDVPSGPPRTPAQQSYYGSALRRRERNRQSVEIGSSRVTPEWFFDHNVRLREEINEPPIKPLSKDSKKGYILDGQQDEGHESAQSPLDRVAINTTREGTSIEIKAPLSTIEAMEIFSQLSRSQSPRVRVDQSQNSAAESTSGLGATIGDFMKQMKARLDDQPIAIFGMSDAESEKDQGKKEHASVTSDPKTSSDRQVQGSQIEGKPQYFINSMQDLEIRKTARGLMKLPLEHSRSQTERAFQKSHLLLHYSTPGGDYLLNSLVDRIALDLDCDIISLNAQDIADLIASEGLDNEVSTAGSLLSYEVYYREKEFDLPGIVQSSMEPSESEDQDIPEDNDQNFPHMQPFGAPVIIGKPFAINLKDLAKSSGSFGGSIQRNMLRNFFDPPDKEEKFSRKSSPHIFGPIIEFIVSSAQRKRDLRGSSTTSAYSKPVLIHVKDLKAIQETSTGYSFLLELYEQVQQARAGGKQTMIIGTDTVREWVPYSKQKIEDMQKDSLDEISRTIVVTPVFPNHAAKRALLHDKQRNVMTINMRHLWSMMRLKDTNVFEPFKHGFWNRDFVDQLHSNDHAMLMYHVWSFGYVHRLSTILAALDDDVSFKSKGPILDQAFQLLAASDNAKFEWAEEQNFRQSKEISIPIQPQQSQENPRIASIRRSATRYERRLMSGIIEADKMNTTFNDIHIPIETIDALNTLTTLSLVRPDAFSYGVLASDKIPGLLLYGPPGTGKTLAAKAVAKESGVTMLEISAADINNMYVGEGEKNVQALFSLAKKLSPCIVFLDEADAMFSARATSGKRVSHRELLNQFLKEWDGMSNDAGGAFIMVATNRPMDLDDAVLRRLPRRLLVDLPTENDRLEILKIHLRNEQLSDDVNISDLAKRTPFYSGSDLKNLAVAAALNCVREENHIAKQHQGADEYKHPERRTLKAVNFEKALEEITASISEDMTSLREIKKFDEQYGDKRGKRRKGPVFGFKDAKEADKVLDTVKVRQ